MFIYLSYVYVRAPKEHTTEIQSGRNETLTFRKLRFIRSTNMKAKTPLLCAAIIGGSFILGAALIAGSHAIAPKYATVTSTELVDKSAYQPTYASEQAALDQLKAHAAYHARTQGDTYDYAALVDQVQTARYYTAAPTLAAYRAINATANQPTDVGIYRVAYLESAQGLEPVLIRLGTSPSTYTRAATHAYTTATRGDPGQIAEQTRLAVQQIAHRINCSPSLRGVIETTYVPQRSTGAEQPQLTPTQQAAVLKALGLDEAATKVASAYAKTSAQPTFVIEISPQTIAAAASGYVQSNVGQIAGFTLNGNRNDTQITPAATTPNTLAGANNQIRTGANQFTTSLRATSTTIPVAFVATDETVFQQFLASAQK